MAEIKMTLQEYNDLINQRDEAIKRAAEAEKREAEVRLQGGDSDLTARLSDAVLAALPVVKFASGNLDPRTVRGWPYPELETFAEAIETLPGVDAPTKETALEFRNFVHEGQQVEAERYSGDAARFNGNVTLTLVFASDQERAAFMDSNKIPLPEDLSEVRKRFFVCSYKQAIH